MTEKQSRRGRPKGSGIDDTAILGKITRALATDSRLNATTAIRKIGVSDPSTIRRLRDKLKVVSPSKPSLVVSRRTTKKAEIVQRAKGAGTTTRLADAPASPHPVPNFSALADEAQAPAETAAPLEPPKIDPTAAFAPGTSQSVQSEALRLATEAASAVMRLYIHCMSHAAQMNPMLLALQGQTFMHQMMSSAFRPPTGPTGQS